MSMMRIGQGFDAHAFQEGRVLVLGGVTIEGEVGLAGHSDADVLSHAVADALLGAARLGDIGKLFPPDDLWHGSSSMEILRETNRALTRSGWRCVNVDSTIVAERPRLAPFVGQMQRNVAAALHLADDAVSIKATSTDGLGFTGRGDGMAAMAVVLIQRGDP